MLACVLLQLWHPMDKLPEAQDMSPVKSEDLTSFDWGWNVPSSGSHASFFTGSERKRTYFALTRLASAFADVPIEYC